MGRLCNKFIDTKYSINALDLPELIRSNQCVRVLHQDWNGFGFPNSEKRGVYFLFGKELKEDKNGIYIGKASFGSSIGKRLNSHMAKHKNKEFFTMDGYHSETYILEWIISIDMDFNETPFLASALEEYLITNLKKRINLINGTGN